jgi:hypothetical protein
MPNPSVDLSNLSADQIRSAMEKLTPEKLQALRLAAAQSGLLDADQKFQRLANGSISITVNIPFDLAEPLMEMVKAVNEPPHPYIEGILLQGLSGWFQGFGPEEEAPAVVPTTKIPLGTPAGAPTT